MTLFDKAEFLRASRLCVLVDSVDYLETALAPKFEQLIRQLISAGVHLIQLRDKRLNDRQLIEMGRRLVEFTRNTGSRMIMNDRADLALLVQADGVHLGQEDISLADAQKILGTEKIIGISTHSLAQAQQATEQGADYIGVGPVFVSHTKSFDQYVGLSLLEAVAKEKICPAFAIGGIDLSNVQSVVNAGMHRVAVSSAICQADSPRQAAAKMLEKLR